jgi:hypothetical protein
MWNLHFARGMRPRVFSSIRLWSLNALWIACAVLGAALPAMAQTARMRGATKASLTEFALDLGPSSAYVNFGAPASLQLTQVTIEMWMRRDGRR